MGKNYYAILGIPHDAKSSKIRTTYRCLAKEFHPVYYSGGREIFNQIQTGLTPMSCTSQGSAIRVS
jgi:curved DNA-binding protein CbpA